MGDIKSAQIALDPELSSQLGDAGRRDLLYQVKQDASRFTNPQDELIEAMISLARRTEADMASAPRPTLPALEPDNPCQHPGSQHHHPGTGGNARILPPCHDESLDDLRPGQCSRHHPAHLRTGGHSGALAGLEKQESGASAAVRAGQAPGRSPTAPPRAAP